MRTIGKYLKEIRLKKRISLSNLENEIKVKKNFIQAIEEEEWQKLPDYPVVVGFVKSIANCLQLNPKATASLLKRDYLPKSLKGSPDPEVNNRFFWNPKRTFFVGVGIIIVLILGYLIYQYFQFISPPKLEMLSPKENQIVIGKKVRVSGRTNTDAKITINNQPVIVDQNGFFEEEIAVVKETQELVIKAISRSGKETVLRRDVKVE